MKRAFISTDFWEDEKVARCHWIEKFIMLALWTQSQMTTFGFIRLDLGKLADKINSGSNSRWPDLPPIEEDQIRRVVASLRRRRIIMVSTDREFVSIYFVNFLKHSVLPPNIPRSWPKLIERLAPPAKIEAAIRGACVEFCKGRGMDVPRGLAPRRG